MSTLFPRSDTCAISTFCHPSGRRCAFLSHLPPLPCTSGTDVCCGWLRVSPFCCGLLPFQNSCQWASTCALAANGTARRLLNSAPTSHHKRDGICRPPKEEETKRPYYVVPSSARIAPYLRAFYCLPPPRHRRRSRCLFDSRLGKFRRARLGAGGGAVGVMQARLICRGDGLAPLGGEGGLDVLGLRLWWALGYARDGAPSG